MLLNSFPELNAGNVDEAEAATINNAPAKSFDVGKDRTGFRFRVNGMRLPEVSLLWIDCNVPVKIRFATAGYFRCIFQIKMESLITIGGRTVRSRPRSAGYIVPDDVEWRAEHPLGFENLSLRVHRQALERKLQSLVGTSEIENVKFDQPSDLHPASTQLLSSAVFQLAAELNEKGRCLSPIALAELEQSIVIRILLFGQHNHTALLQRPFASPSNHQVKRVEDFIIANWDRPLDIDVLSTVAGVSARSLFRSFRSLRGSSPHAFMKKVRLDRARAELLNGGELNSVMAVALRCGFNSLGHFAAAYRSQFGELPSATMKRSRSA